MRQPLSPLLGIAPPSPQPVGHFASSQHTPTIHGAASPPMKADRIWPLAAARPASSWLANYQPFPATRRRIGGPILPRTLRAPSTFGEALSSH